MPLSDALQEPQSWGEALNQYTKEKTTRPRPDSEYVMPRRETRYEKSRQEIEYHPILQTFRDAPREKAAAERETERAARAAASYHTRRRLLPHALK